MKKTKQPTERKGIKNGDCIGFMADGTVTISGIKNPKIIELKPNKDGMYIFNYEITR